MAFEWNRIHKWEEQYENTIVYDVAEYVCEAYGVTEVGDLTEEQIKEVETFCNEELYEYSVMQIGFRHLLNDWDYANEG